MFNDNKSTKKYLGKVDQKKFKDGNSVIVFTLTFEDLKILGDAYRDIQKRGSGDLMSGGDAVTIEIKKSMKGFLYAELKDAK